jgi:hypothetical protein
VSVVFKDDEVQNDREVTHCKEVCKLKEQIQEAHEQGRTTNYGCVGFWPGAKTIPWEQPAGFGSAVAGGRCACDNWLINEIADTVLEVMPMIAQVCLYGDNISYRTLTDGLYRLDATS